MRLNRLIILIITVLAGMHCIQADELSDLVSFIAGSTVAPTKNSGVSKDLQSILPETTEGIGGIDIDVLGGVAAIMTEDASYEYILNATSGASTSYNVLTSATSGLWKQGSTLSKQGFCRPVPGIVTSSYGWRQQFNRMHKGVDLLLQVGDTVRAAVNGVVKKVAYDSDGYGNYLVLTHPDGMETLYGHLQYAIVGQGQYVSIGTPIAIGGNTGNSTGPHLHFETHKNGVAIDPTMIFNFSKSYSTIENRQTYTDPVKATNTLAETPLAGRRTYIVRQGDTLQSISQRSGVSVMRLCQLNMLTEFAPLETGRMIKLK